MAWEYLRILCGDKKREWKMMNLLARIVSSCDEGRSFFFFFFFSPKSFTFISLGMSRADLIAAKSLPFG